MPGSAVSQRAGTSQAPRHPQPERGSGACLTLGEEISLELPLLPGHGSGPYCSPIPSPKKAFQNMTISDF